MSRQEIQEIVSGVEEKLGWIFVPEEVECVLQYTIHKSAMLQKSNDYIPILFENELRDLVIRAEINHLRRKNICVQNAI